VVYVWVGEWHACKMHPGQPWQMQTALPTCAVGSMLGPQLMGVDLRCVCTDVSGNRMTWCAPSKLRLRRMWLATVDRCLPVL
jgi:hypothetical protein